jgi:hypothetical protein
LSIIFYIHQNIIIKKNAQLNNPTIASPPKLPPIPPKILPINAPGIAPIPKKRDPIAAPAAAPPKAPIHPPPTLPILFLVFGPKVYWSAFIDDTISTVSTTRPTITKDFAPF